MRVPHAAVHGEARLVVALVQLRPDCLAQDVVLVLDIARAGFEAVVEAVEGLVDAAESAVRQDRIAELVASGQVGEQLRDLLPEGGRGCHRGDGRREGVVCVGVCGSWHEVSVTWERELC